MGLLLLWAFIYLVIGLFQTRQPASLFSRSNLTVILVVVASLFATLLNPYGIRLLLFLLRTATIPRPEIAEWYPLNIWSGAGVIYVLTVLVTVLGLFLSKRKRSATLVLLFVVMILLPLVAVRHLPLFALAALVLAGEHIGDVWQQWSSSRRKGGSRSRRARFEAPLLGLFLLAAIAFIAASAPHWGCIRVHPVAYPYRAVALLKEGEVRGNMAVHFDWGQYAIWHLGPTIQVSIDGRRETVYDEEAYGLNLAFFSGVGRWDALLTDHPTDLALVPKDTPPYNLLTLEPNWVFVYEDDLSAIAVKEGSPLIEQITGIAPPSIPETEYLCFPAD
jgi:hypothetical protein